ncbi:ATP-binding protein [Streptomyces sp. TRM66268-LWL]|uniref:ATP-binding protein n=1 Tax=Streptomyces polyasparticus TaxID=2767826 RepID=A0ABR7SFA8_9ACTN|nr:ATP-binding protein [Streptomyces polyasparticus]MBC9713156.1 ATP-binding protein [Streptomyces polyasparticus]
MVQDWAGISERDRSIATYLDAMLVPNEGGRVRPPHQPLTLLVGPRGSGKTSLLGALAAQATEQPAALLDLHRLADGHDLLDVLEQLAADYERRLKDVPRMRFGAFRTVCTALRLPLPRSDRPAARAQLRRELTRPSSGLLEDASQVASAAGALTGIPALLTNALNVLPVALKGLRRFALSWRLYRIFHPGAVESALDLLVTLNYAYQNNTSRDREGVQKVVGELFVQCLRRAYHRKDWAVRCLLLLDNVDSPLGAELLRLLLDERTAQRPDPLVILAAAGSYPTNLSATGLDDALGVCWPDGAGFEPVQVREGLRAGPLRDLTRGEVAAQAAGLLVPGVPVTRQGAGAPWLGWAVYEMTQGQPAATAALLALLENAPRDLPWEDRLQTVLRTASDTAELRTRLLPLDAADGFEKDLARAAAAPDLAEALVTGWFRAQDAGARTEAFVAFCADPLATQHKDTGNPAVDGTRQTLHPVLRRVLLTMPEAQEIHGELYREAAARADAGTAAYHALAGEDVATAAGYLDSLFGVAQAEEWCRELARLRRVPLPPRLTSPPATEAGIDVAWTRYEQLVAHLRDDSVDAQLRTITRLLAASWLAPEPKNDNATDWVGDPYRDPLGDPYASLYPEINARLKTLAAAHTQQAGYALMLFQKASQYDGKPW